MSRMPAILDCTRGHALVAVAALILLQGLLRRVLLMGCEASADENALTNMALDAGRVPLLG